MKRKDEKTRKKKDLEILGKYPSLSIIGGDNVDAKIISSIKKTYRNIIFMIDSKKKNETELILCEFLKHIKKYNFHTQKNSRETVDKFWEIYKPKAGWILNEIYKNLKDKDNDKLGFFLAAVHSTITMLTNQMFKQCNLINIMPDTFMLCSLYKDNVMVRFKSMTSKATPSGRIYKHKKNMMVDGKEYELWFTKHAIERIMQRVANFDVMKIVAEFMHHAHFEFSGFGKFQHLLCAYLATPISGSVILEVDDDIPTMNGHEPKDVISKYLYFPFVIDENKIVCKSGLIPGFYGTPEFLLRQSIEKNNVTYKGSKVNLNEPLLTKNGLEIIPCKIVKDFYEKNCDGQMVNTNDFHFISYIFHRLDMPQYYMGEMKSFTPIISRNIKE